MASAPLLDFSLYGWIAAATVLLLLAFLVAKKFLFQKQQKKNTFLLLGLSDAGKTLLYHQLRFGKWVETCTSMKENEGTFILFNEKPTARPLHIIDLPGHEKQRFRFTEYAPIAGGIIFLVDVSTVKILLRDVAEYLYDILSNPYLRKNKTPLLVACNKRDLAKDASEDEIRLLLEKEMEQLRKTRSASPEQLMSTNDSGSNFLGFEEKPFEFSDLKNRIDFVMFDSLEFENAYPVTQWIRNLYRAK